jgi:hypothetical protein
MQTKHIQTRLSEGNKLALMEFNKQQKSVISALCSVIRLVFLVVKSFLSTRKNI